jgi:putative serine protease PepD
VLGRDEVTDIAVLAVRGGKPSPAPLRLGTSRGLRVGDAIAAIGDPFDYSRSLSTGLVSGLDRTIEAANGFTLAHAVQTDAAVNPGNSGGPLLRGDGTVIGVVDRIVTGQSADQSSGVAFAVPSDVVRRELPALIAGRRAAHHYLGMSTADATDGTPGALVDAVTAQTPASRARIRTGDVIVRAGATPISGSGDLVAAIAQRRPGDRFVLAVRRGSTLRNVAVTLGAEPVR